MSRLARTMLTWIGCAVAVALPAARGLVVEGAPYHAVPSWGPVPDAPGLEWEMCGAAVAPKGDRLFMARRADPPILELDPATGKIRKSWAQGMLVWPHSVYVDRDGFVWVADATIGSGPTSPLAKPMESGLRAGRGHQVLKFTQDGTLVMALGIAGVPGADERHFNAPTGVVVAKNGDIFVSDGHGGSTNNRVVVFSKDGTFLRTWGRKGNGPGEFNEPHAIAMDARERVYVADRANGRIEIFDTAGTFLDQWTQFGRRPSGIAFTPDDTIYVTSHDTRGNENIVTIGRATDGSVTAVIKDAVEGIDGIAVDRTGQIFVTSATGRAARTFTTR